MTSEFPCTPYRSTIFALLPSRTQHSALDKPDPTRGGLLVGLTFSEFIMNGSAYLSPIARRFKRSVSASLAGEVSMVREGLAECKWIRGVLESAVYRDCDRRPCTDDVQFNFLPTVTVMKANSATHFDPSIVCVLSTPRVPLDHLIRESFGCHCRRSAEELCLFRRSICKPCVPNVAGCPTA